ncbi:Fc receptor-like protein 5 [Cyprinodon tularosa]|uniref:Fc receptor-like protein 5 n=1 Tax=Cyprinodon tularosa TaxID=77115 RepID=UPI0018E1DD9B|nr:Fc receptor-like protein 5 [Cyprinodon tularosa]
MDAVISLLILAVLPHLVVSEVPTVAPYRSVVEIVSGRSRIFSGEPLRLRCNIDDFYKSTWNYLWFRGSVQLPQSGEIFPLWKANIKESGKYSCQGEKETQIGSIKTHRSPPVEINVDGGFVILETPQHPILVGDSPHLLCRVRGQVPVHQTVLYRDGTEVMVQNGSSLYLRLPHVTLRDQGMYSCRASWDTKRQTYSVLSVTTPVNILEVLTLPVLEIDDKNLQPTGNKIKLICHTQYNAHAPAPPVNYYFYKNNHLLGPAKSQNHIYVTRAPGWYSCRAKVPKLDIMRWSEPKSFGEVTGLEISFPNGHHHHHRNQMSSSPSVSHPHFSSNPPTQPTTPKHLDPTLSFDLDTELHLELPVLTSRPPPDQFPGQTNTPEP